MIINDNEETVTCRICGEQCKRIYGKHLKFKHDNMTTDEYKRLFPGAPIMALLDKKNTTKNSGKHMKEEKYRKMFSEKIKGEKNPMHKSKTTDEFRKSISPFSIEFYNVRYPDLTLSQKQDKLNEFIKKVSSVRIGSTNIEYYLNKGLNEEDAKKALSERQSTFSKEKCIEKYGKEDGFKIWMNRQEKWLDSLNKNGNLKIGYSSISQKLFREIDNRLPNDEFLYAENGGEFKIKGKCNTKWYMYDFTSVNRKKIIEYNGDQYHANPDIFNENDYPHPFRKNIKSKDIWLKDEIKIESANYLGYEVLVIWESEFNDKLGFDKKEKTIKKCIDFIIGKNKETINENF